MEPEDSLPRSLQPVTGPQPESPESSSHPWHPLSLKFTVMFSTGVEKSFFHFRRHDQTSSGSRPISYPVGTRGFSPEIKRPEHDTDHPHPSSTEVKNACSYNFSTPIIFTACCLGKHRLRLHCMELGYEQEQINHFTSPFRRNIIISSTARFR
jgi:hypothetical protein